MHRLFREVRFSINPFGAESRPGFNSYASKPCGDGLAVYLALGVELSGPLNPDSGFVVNVSEIDRAVRRRVVPDFEDTIRGLFGQQRPSDLDVLFDLLEKAGRSLQAVFTPRVSKLVLSLNPYRKMTLLRENDPVRLYSEQFEFAAMHRLWNDRFSEAENFQTFGKCANPAGHGHNYILEVTVRIPDTAAQVGWISEFERGVEEYFLSIVDHKNLNLDVPLFSRLNPTVENLASYAWECLCDKFDGVCLNKITVWENNRTCCTCEGND